MLKETALYQTKQIRQFERKAIDELGISEDELMARAGLAAFEALGTLYSQVRSIAVFCGSGNNGGDGYVLARLAKEHGLSVNVYQNKPVEELPPAARQAAVKAIASGVSIHHFDEFIESDIDLIVDALLGIGLEGNVHGALESIIEMINESPLPVLSIDVPSGLDADTGAKQGVCIIADTTITFIALKAGMYTVDGPDHCGEIICHTLQLQKNDTTIKPVAYLINHQLVKQVIKPRRKNSHKGLFGHALIIGGGLGMPGAPYLAAIAAYRTGAGAVTIATHPSHADKCLSGLPEAMIYGVSTQQDLYALLSRATVCIIGPGLGEDAWAESLFKAAIAAQLPLVIDASALRMLAHHPQHDDNWILTPHPGEAGELLGKAATDVQADRLKAAREIQQQYGGSVVLKGVGTVIDHGENNTNLCAAGNPGMASAGMGDVLSGIIGGLLCQGVSLQDAAKLGVWLHAKAADDAVAKQGERGLLASDLMVFLRRRINSAR